MKKQKKSYSVRNFLAYFSNLILILISSILVTACGGGSGSSQVAEPKIISYEVSSRIVATERMVINEGDSITFTAVFNNGTGSIDNGVGIITSGTPIEFLPTKDNTEFTLSVVNSTGQKVSRSIFIYFIDPPQITTFSASSLTVKEGDSIALVGEYINGSGFLDLHDGRGVGRVNPNFSFNVSPRFTTDYMLTVTNNYGASISRTLTVVVEPTPIVLSVFPTVNLDSELLLVSVDVTHSDFEIASVSASIDEVTKPLAFDSLSKKFNDTFSISSLVSGEQTIIITAEDVKGNVVSKQAKFTLDRKPTVILSKPLKQSVLRTSQLPIEVSCHDDISDCKLTVTLEDDGEILIERKATNIISDSLDLTNYDGRKLTLKAEAQDSVNHRVSDEISLYVEMTDTIEEVDSFSDVILDFNGKDILKVTPDRNLRIHEVATDNITEVETISNVLLNGSYLTPTGVIFATDGGPHISGHIFSVYEWSNSQLTEYADDSSFQISGDYSFDTRSIRRFSTGGTVEVANGEFGIRDYSLGNDGVLIFIESGAIKKFESGVVTTLVNEVNNISGITHDSDSRYLYVSSDGSNDRYEIIYRDLGDEVVLSEFEGLNPRKFQDYQINNGWVAFTKPGMLGQKHLWSKDPSGVILQRTVFGSDSVIEKLASNGDIMLVSGGKRYLSKATGELTHVGSSLGETYLVNGIWYRAIGSSLFKLK